MKFENFELLHLFEELNKKNAFSRAFLISVLKKN